MMSNKLQEESAIEAFDPRSINKPVYEKLRDLRQSYDVAKECGTVKKEDYDKRLREQKSQAQELYTYLMTWGLMRLRAEEMSYNDWGNEKPSLAKRAEENQEGKRAMLECFFECLEDVTKNNNLKLASSDGIETLNKMGMNEYLGLTGIALAVAREFSFWADAIYRDIKGGEKE